MLDEVKFNELLRKATRSDIKAHQDYPKKHNDPIALLEAAKLLESHSNQITDDKIEEMINDRTEKIEKWHKTTTNSVRVDPNGEIYYCEIEKIVLQRFKHKHSSISAKSS